MSPDSSTVPPLTVTLILSTALKMRGGLETCAEQFARGLSSRGHRVVLLAADTSGSSSLHKGDYTRLTVPCPNIAQHPLWTRLRLPWFPTVARALLLYASVRASRAAQRALLTSDVTLTFLEPETALFSNYLREHGVPNVSYFSGTMTRFWFRRDQSAVRVAISRFLADAARRAHGIQCDGVVTPAVQSAWLQFPMPQMRERSTRLVYVGRLEENKGVLLFPELARALHQSFPDLTLELAGSGPLARRLRQAGPALRLHGDLDRAGVRELLSRCDAFIFPSWYESFGIAPLEAQAVGIPVIASDLPALREALGDSAVFLPAHAPSDWARALEELLRDPARRTALAYAGRAHAAHRPWATAAAELENFLLLARANPQRQPGDAIT